MTENPYRDEIIGNLTAENAVLLAEVDEMRDALKLFDERQMQLMIARQAIARVRALHEPLRRDSGWYCNHCVDGSDMGLDVDWPCATINALEGRS